MNQEMTMPGGMGEMQTEMTMEQSSVPKAGAEAGTTDVTMTYEKAEMSMTAGGQPIPGADNPLKAFIGKSITAIFDADGAVVDIKNLEAFLGDDPALAMMFNKSSLKHMISQGNLMARPDSPVSPGDSWEFSIDYPMPMMKMSMKGKYTYEKDEEVDGATCARIVIDGTLAMDAADSDPKKEDEDPQAAQQRERLKAMDFKIQTSSISGTAHYDFDLANITKTDMKIDIVMSMKDPTTQQSVTMPTKSKVTSVLKAKKTP